MEKLLKKYAKQIRFCVVGGINTLLDFSLLFLFVNLGLNKIPANYLSTGISFIVSFFLNRSYTLKKHDSNIKKQFILFTVVTLTGIWGLQPLIIWSLTPLIAKFTSNSQIILFITKLVATIVTLIWNYLFYSRTVFKDKQITDK
jgi:putative flippase GtrA